jgi:hypothetical protein
MVEGYDQDYGDIYITLSCEDEMDNYYDGAVADTLECGETVISFIEDVDMNIGLQSGFSFECILLVCFSPSPPCH